MITIDEIRQAMLLLKDPYAKHKSTAETLMYSLRLYQDRGEYDGTLESAIACLKQASYEVAGDV